MSEKNGTGTFWEHLDDLRSVLIKIAVVAVLGGIIAFIFKDILFSIVLAPKNSDFITYRWLTGLSNLVSANESENFTVSLINTGLAQQFVVHVKTALCFGVLCASPYIIYQLFTFIAPALYDNERKYVTRVVGSGYLMFMVGVLVGYYLIFPLTFRFLGTYQVADDVVNMINLDSYMATLVLICISLGVVFELPVVCWLLAKLGFISSKVMKKYRKHAFVAILIIGAIITPTTDIFTLLAVGLPMYLLYEMSILIVGKTINKKKNVESLSMA